MARIPLLIIGEVAYIPFDPEAANLQCSLISACCERACHLEQAVQLIGEIFGDEVPAAAMIDRLVRHAEIRSLGDSYRSKTAIWAEAKPSTA